MSTRLLIIALLLLNLPGSSQTILTDSLRHLLYRTGGKERLPVLLFLGREQHSLNRDSAYGYAAEAMTLSSGASAREKSFACLYFSQSYIPWGWVDSAMAVLRPVLQNNHVEDPAQRDIYFLSWRQQAMLYGMSTRYKESLSILYRLVDEARQYRDSIAVSANMNSIGSVALARDEPTEAMRWFYGALDFSVSAQGYIPVRAAVYINLANGLLQLNRIDSAYGYLKKAIPLARQVQDLYLLATAYRVQTGVFIKKGRLKDAEQAFRALQDVNAKTGISNIADDNLAIVYFYITTNQFERAILLCQKLLADTSDSSGPVNRDQRVSIPAIRLEFYQVLAKAARKAGNESLYKQTLEKIIGLKDSVYAASSAKEIADIRTKYETQIKENVIIQQQALDLTRKNFLFYGLLGFSVLAVAGGVFIFYESRKRQIQRMAIAISTEKQLAESAVQQAEENERLRIAADLHDNLGAYAASLSSNLNYIPTDSDDEQIKNAVRELKSNSAAMIAELNDTIWTLKKASLSMTAISDRVKIFTNRFRRSYPGIKIDVNEDITNDIVFTPSQAFHIYRVIQEAFNNALKHSKGDQVEIRFTSAGTWTIQIADNGIGTGSYQAGTGNGLGNMKRRCLDNHWQIRWFEASPKGSVVEIASTAN